MATYSQKESDMLQTGMQSINDGPLNAFEKIAAINRLQTRVDRGREREINSYRKMRSKEMEGLESTGLTYEEAKNMEKLNKVSDVSSDLSLNSDTQSKDVSRPDNDFIKGSQTSLNKIEEYSGDSSEYESGFGKSFQITEDAGIETPINPSNEVANNVPSSDKLGKLQIT
jgi:hypothetical protein|tara:strand:+ start:63 stop:572 length:510 start_codon:yes stop_codon:yes gene_type:complete